MRSLKQKYKDTTCTTKPFYTFVGLLAQEEEPMRQQVTSMLKQDPEYQKLTRSQKAKYYIALCFMAGYFSLPYSPGSRFENAPELKKHNLI